MKRNSKDIAQKCATPRISRLHAGELPNMAVLRINEIPEGINMCLEVFCS